MPSKPGVVLDLCLVTSYDVVVSAIDLSRHERAALCDLLTSVGPKQQTQCEDWTTRELAAHLVVREGRPDTAFGRLGGPLAAWTEKVESDAASQDYEKLVRLVRNGPPIWSAFRVPWMDGQLNTLEYYVHHEDVRRGSADWKPRELPSDLQDFIWDRLRLQGRVWFNGVPGGVTLVRNDGQESQHKAKGGDPMVTVIGSPGELVLVALGRRETKVEYEGSDEALAAFREAMTGTQQDHLHLDNN